MDEKRDDRYSEIISQAVWLRKQELWREFFSAPMSEREAIVKKINAVRDELRELTPQQRELLDVFKRLASRQGTVMPDFESLYKKMAELDRKIPDRDK